MTTLWHRLKYLARRGRRCALAAVVPSLRAARVDPADALKAE